MVSLPEKNVRYWTSEVEQVIKTRQVEYKYLEEMVGKLTRAAFIVLGATVFINLLCWKLYKCTRGILQIMEDDLLYLRLWTNY